MNGDRCIGEIKKIEAALKRLNAEVSILRSKKTTLINKLYGWMTKNGYEDYNGYKRDKLQPKPKVKRKTKKQKEQDMLNMFNNEGVRDPEGLVNMIQDIMKSKLPQEEES